jgi:hypothetical protein
MSERSIITKDAAPAMGSGPVRGAAVRVLPPDRKRRRGRPVARRFSPEEVAELCAVPLERIQTALAKDPALFFPGARLCEGAWWIPEADVRRLVGGSVTDPPVLFSVKEFARLMGKSVPTIYEWIGLGAIQKRVVMDVICIPASEYWNVPEHRPASADPRPSFFAQKRASKAVEVAG